MSLIDNLESMLARGQDGALLRYGLGNAYLTNGQLQPAIEHLQKALQFDAHYSAAWKLLGQAFATAGHTQQAMDTYESGIANAEAKGDLQAAKEMKVFLRRLRKDR